MRGLEVVVESDIARDRDRDSRYKEKKMGRKKCEKHEEKQREKH